MSTNKFDNYSNKIMSGGLPFNFKAKDFDGTKPFATLSVKDPFYGEGLSITCQTQEDFLNGWTKTVNVTQGERHTWSGKYLFHADGEAAVKFYNGSEGWFHNGALHNANGPAIIFGNTEIYCLNGHILDKEYFTYYVSYMQSIKGKTYPAGLIPIFPHKTEIVEAYNLGLTLFFDTEMNYYWYNQEGQLHHPSAPAVEKSDGTLVWYKLGEKVRESNLTLGSEGRMGTAQKYMDEVHAAVQKALDEALGPTFSDLHEILNSPDWDELSVLFMAAGRRMLDGDHFDDIHDDFIKSYGTEDFFKDFSLELREDFKELVEGVLESSRLNSWLEGLKKENSAKMKDETFKEEINGLFSRAKIQPLKVEKVLSDAEVKELGGAESNSKDLFSFTSSGKSLQDTLDAFVEAAKQLEMAASDIADKENVSNKAIDYLENLDIKKGFVKYGYDSKIEILTATDGAVAVSTINGSTGIQGSTMAIGSITVQGMTGRSASSSQSYYKSETFPFVATSTQEKAASVSGAVPDTQTEKSPESSWGVPLGMLALAGVVGLFGQKKGAIKSTAQVTKVVEEVAEAAAVAK